MIVAFAVFASLLVVSATPVTAASAELAVGSQQTTESDFEAATLDNANAYGTGGGGFVQALSFDDSVEQEPADPGVPKNWVVKSSVGSVNVTTTTAAVGSQSIAVVGDGANFPKLRPDHQPRSATVTQNVTYWIKTTNPTGFAYLRLNEGGSHPVLAGMRNGDLAFNNGSWNTISTLPDAGEWVKITFFDIDPATDTYRVKWSAGAESGTTGPLDMNGAMSTGWDELEIATSKSKTAYFDGISYESLDTAAYESPNQTVSNAQQAWVNLTLNNNATATVRALGINETTGESQVVNSAQFSSTGNHTLDISGTNYSKWRVNVSFEKTGQNPTAQLHDEGILFQNNAPSVDNASAKPQNGGNIEDTGRTLSINVSDPQFGTGQGDQLNATFYVDGTETASKTVTSNGTISTTISDLDGGSHSWHVTLEDQYGAVTTSETFTFNAPSKLYVYKETKPSQLVDDKDLNLTVRFYPLEAGDASDVVTRTVSDGVVDLTGLPTDNRFVVTVRANNSQYTYRRVVVDSLYETNRVYLLNESKQNSQVVFELQDPTGQFPPEETILYVEKPIRVNGSTSYQTIAGDTFGSTGRFPVILQTDERYRLRVETADSANERILGSYTVYGATLEPLKIQRIEPQSEASPGAVVYGGLSSYNESATVAVRHLDPGENVTDVTYQIREGDTVIVANTTSSADRFAHMYQVGSSETEYTVEYWLTREDGSTSHGSFVAGQVPGVGDRLNMDRQVLSIASWGIILATMGLLAIVDAQLAPLGGTGMATGLTTIGTVAIPLPILGVAGAISVLSLFGGGR